MPGTTPAMTEGAAAAPHFVFPRALVLRLHPHLGGDRAGVADRFDVTHVAADLQPVEVARHNAVAVEVEQPACRGEQEAEILPPRDLSHLSAHFVRSLVPACRRAVLELILV